MSKAVKLFMGGLPCDITRHDLAGLLGYPNKVRVNLKQRADGRGNRGFAFISVKGKKLAADLVSHEFKIRDRSIFLQYCDSKEDSAQGSNQSRLFVKGIPHDMSDDDISSFFRNITADCKTAYAIRNQQGWHKGYGFIEMKNQVACQILLNVGVFEVKEGVLVVEEFKKLKTKDHQFELGAYSTNQKSNYTSTGRNSRNQGMINRGSLGEILNYENFEIQGDSSMHGLSESGYKVNSPFTSKNASRLFSKENRKAKIKNPIIKRV